MQHEEGNGSNPSFVQLSFNLYDGMNHLNGMLNVPCRGDLAFAAAVTALTAQQVDRFSSDRTVKEYADEI
jgi:hypothetical protein